MKLGKIISILGIYFCLVTIAQCSKTPFLASKETNQEELRFYSSLFGLFKESHAPLRNEFNTDSPDSSSKIEKNEISKENQSRVKLNSSTPNITVSFLQESESHGKIFNPVVDLDPPFSPSYSDNIKSEEISLHNLFKSTTKGFIASDPLILRKVNENKTDSAPAAVENSENKTRNNQTNESLLLPIKAEVNGSVSPLNAMNSTAPLGVNSSASYNKNSPSEIQNNTLEVKESVNVLNLSKKLKPSTNSPAIYNTLMPQFMYMNASDAPPARVVLESESRLDKISSKQTANAKSEIQELRVSKSKEAITTNVRKGKSGQDFATQLDNLSNNQTNASEVLKNQTDNTTNASNTTSETTANSSIDPSFANLNYENVSIVNRISAYAKIDYMNRDFPELVPQVLKIGKASYSKGDSVYDQSPYIMKDLFGNFQTVIITGKDEGTQRKLWRKFDDRNVPENFQRVQYGPDEPPMKQIVQVHLLKPEEKPNPFMNEEPKLDFSNPIKPYLQEMTQKSLMKIDPQTDLGDGWVRKEFEDVEYVPKLHSNAQEKKEVAPVLAMQSENLENPHLNTEIKYEEPEILRRNQDSDNQRESLKANSIPASSDNSFELHTAINKASDLTINKRLDYGDPTTTPNNFEKELSDIASKASVPKELPKSISDIIKKDFVAAEPTILKQKLAPEHKKVDLSLKLKSLSDDLSFD